MIKNATGYRPVSGQKGIALLQVLLVSAVISLLAIQFSYSAKQQVELASLFDKRVRASLKMHSVQQELSYAFLTNHIRRTQQTRSELVSQWNFYGKPFSLESGVRITLQDHGGLLSQTMSRDSLWHSYLTENGYSDSDATLALNQLKDWQDPDQDSWFAGATESEVTDSGLLFANRWIQTPYELPELLPQLPRQTGHKVSTHYPTSGFNPLRAPDELFRTLFDQQQADYLISRRDEGSLRAQDVRSLLPSRTEIYDYTFIASSGVRMFVEVSEQDVTVSETIEMRIQRNKSKPLLILARY